MRTDVGGHFVEYETHGAGPDVVTLAHGLASNRKTWGDQIPALSRRYRVLTWDMRGHGASDTPPGPWTLADLASDLRALLDALGVARTHLVGHSGGGVAALQFALTYPERLDHLVLASCASQANARAAAWYESLAERAEREGGAFTLSAFGVDEGDRAVAPDGVGFARASRCMATLHEAPLTPRLAEIRCPTSIIHGADDFIGPGGSVILHRGIPGSRLTIVEGRGHGLHLEDPAGFNRLVEDALGIPSA